jgi:hypothetical protein
MRPNTTPDSPPCIGPAPKAAPDDFFTSKDG